MPMNWNDPALLWNDPNLPWKRAAQSWNDTGLPWKNNPAGGGGEPSTAGEAIGLLLALTKAS